MQELDDNSLLREYVARDSGEAFAALVTRHVNKVYSVALRNTGNTHSAEEITQAVFVILAKKANQLRRHAALSGWIYQTARLTAVTYLRSEIRRTRREQEALMQSTLNENESETWTQIAPLLDAAMAGLNETDRHAVVLRFFDGKSMGEVGAALGANEDAAKKRVNRAVEKLQKFFLKRGVTSTTATLAGAISANSVQAAPVALAKSITVIAIAKGSIATASTLTLVKGALNLMAWTKIKTATSIGAVILATSATVIALDDSLFNSTSSTKLFAAPDNIAILRPTQFSQDPGAWTLSRFTPEGKRTYRLMGRKQTVEQILSRAYDTFPTQMVLPADLPQGDFDYLTTLPNYQDQIKALQAEIKNKLGLIGHREMRATDVLLLKVKNPDATGLKLHPHSESSGVTAKDGKIYVMGQAAGFIENYLQNALKLPVLDRTSLTNRYDYVLDEHLFDGTSDPNIVKNFVLDEFGLELVPTNMPIEMVVVEKVN